MGYFYDPYNFLFLGWFGSGTQGHIHTHTHPHTHWAPQSCPVGETVLRTQATGSGRPVPLESRPWRLLFCRLLETVLGVFPQWLLSLSHSLLFFLPLLFSIILPFSLLHSFCLFICLPLSHENLLEFQRGVSERLQLPKVSPSPPSVSSNSSKLPFKSSGSRSSRWANQALSGFTCLFGLLRRSSAWTGSCCISSWTGLRKVIDFRFVQFLLLLMVPERRRLLPSSPPFAAWTRGLSQKHKHRWRWRRMKMVLGHRSTGPRQAQANLQENRRKKGWPLQWAPLEQIPVGPWPSGQSFKVSQWAFSHKFWVLFKGLLLHCWCLGRASLHVAFETGFVVCCLLWVSWLEHCRFFKAGCFGDQSIRCRS